MELGIGPLVTAGMVMQLLAVSKIIEMDPSVEKDKVIYFNLQKLLAILITVGEALAYVFSGMYGSVGDLGIINALLIVVQLITAGFMVRMGRKGEEKNKEQRTKKDMLHIYIFTYIQTNK